MIKLFYKTSFGANKIYFRGIYSGLTRKLYKEWKYIDQKIYLSDYYDVSLNKYGVKCGTSLRFCENKGWINEIDPYSWLQKYFR